MATRPPGSGYHQAEKVPDRLRDAFAYFGADAQKYNPDSIPHKNENERKGMVHQVMGMHSNLRTLSSLDRVRITLDSARRKPSDDRIWNDLVVLMRTMEFCCELVEDPRDQFPEGEKLWIDLGECTWRRRPYVWQIGKTGPIVLPVFSYEEYIVHYFQRLKEFPSVWFPHPKMGTAREQYIKQRFPVLAHGNLRKLASLATIATPHQFMICVNPTQESCRMLTYPELLHVAHARDSSDNSVAFHQDLNRILDSRYWEGVRMDPNSIQIDSKLEIVCPRIARDELQMLLFDISDILSVFVRVVPTRLFKRMTSTPLTTEIIILSKTKELSTAAQARINGWSFLTECTNTVEVVVTNQLPTDDARRVYEAKEAGWLRNSYVPPGQSLREKLNYDAE